ncbi:unnamed protein product [Prorocentrum cordatum]|uniref:Uncharacterized protein n=1 Tax=Prorocentrum cordatum TaxID=2364126 RepID=A0ABN9WA50_9DINO|nr:unnamed protein product [Polarella glacialis]
MATTVSSRTHEGDRILMLTMFAIVTVVRKLHRPERQVTRSSSAASVSPMAASLFNFNVFDDVCFSPWVGMPCAGPCGWPQLAVSAQGSQGKAHRKYRFGGVANA